MSDTPRTDKIMFTVDVCDGEDVVNLWFARNLERELNAANSEIDRLTAKVAQFYEGAEEQKQRIKRLEEAGDALAKTQTYDLLETINWRKAKEVNP